mmetsp:Transcript_17988/g.44258  ORF Transcript_17988/g.44258 Transcript_17988/m.44258 type:complete len:221 (+) Transcript_17988:51-713(+)
MVYVYALIAAAAAAATSTTARAASGCYQFDMTVRRVTFAAGRTKKNETVSADVVAYRNCATRYLERYDQWAMEYELGWYETYGVCVNGDGEKPPQNRRVLDGQILCKLNRDSTGPFIRLNMTRTTRTLQPDCVLFVKTLRGKALTKYSGSSIDLRFTKQCNVTVKRDVNANHCTATWDGDSSDVQLSGNFTQGTSHFYCGANHMSQSDFRVRLGTRWGDN